MSAPCSALRPTFSRILLASDFSCRSLIAARYARLFAKLDGGLLWIAHAVTPSVSPDGVPVPVTDHAEQDMTQHVDCAGQAMQLRQAEGGCRGCSTPPGAKVR